MIPPASFQLPKVAIGHETASVTLLVTTRFGADEVPIWWEGWGREERRRSEVTLRVCVLAYERACVSCEEGREEVALGEREERV